MISVLIVDDDKLALEGMRSMIPWQQYHMQVVGEAANGLNALKFLAHTEVDLVIVDLAMPVMDGLTFIAKCKEKHPAILYVVMTFHETFEYVQQALRLGVIDYISKLQLSADNYQDVFSRIEKRINLAPQHTLVTDANHFSQLGKLFRGPMWICDDMCFENLMRNLEKSNFSPYDVELMVTESLARSQAQIGMAYAPVPHFHNMIDVKIFLQNYRKNVLKQAHNGTLASTEACLFVAADYINQHYSQPVRMETVAEHAKLSRSYLSNCFTKCFGITLNEFLRRKRIHEAIALIKTTDLPLNRIAEEVGYENYKYFKKIFFDLLEVNPKEYRLQNRD